MFERKQCLTLCLVLLTGCGGGNGGGGNPNTTLLGGNSSGGGAELGESGVATELGESGVATELEGTWTSACLPGQDSGADGSNLETLMFNKNRFEFRIDSFDDTNCVQPSSSIELQRQVGTFAIGSAVATSSGIQAQAIDVLVTAVNGTAISKKAYSVFHIDPAGLFLGEDQSDTPADRPNVLDLNKLYTKLGDTVISGAGTDALDSPDDSGTDDNGIDNGGIDDGGTDNGGPDSGGADGGNTDNGGTDDGATDNTATVQALTGQWRGECAVNPVPGGASHYIRQYSFSGTGVALRTENYEDPGCTVQLSAGDTSTKSGNYMLGETVTSAEGMEAIEINFIFTNIDGEVTGIEQRDLIAVERDTLYVGAESEDGARTDSLDLQEPLQRQ